MIARLLAWLDAQHAARVAEAFDGPYRAQAAEIGLRLGEGVAARRAAAERVMGAFLAARAEAVQAAPQRAREAIQ